MKYDWYEQKLPPSYFFVDITSMSFYLYWYNENKKYLSYVNLSGPVQTKIGPLLFFLVNIKIFILCQFIWTGTNKNWPPPIFFL